MADDEIEETPPTPCGFCAQTGLILAGWDAEGNDLMEVCGECDGDGLLNS